MRRSRLASLAVGVLLGAGLAGAAFGLQGLAQATGRGTAADPAQSASVEATIEPAQASPGDGAASLAEPEPDPTRTPTHTPTPTPTPTPERFSRPELTARLTELFGAEDARVEGILSVAVVDDDGRTVLDLEARVAAMPASTMKLVTAAAALEILGADFRYRTEVRRTADIDEHGTVDGHLILVGSGDPTLGSPVFGTIEPDRPRTPMEDLADRVVSAGVRRVTGRVLGDPTVFADEPIASGWLDRYFDQFDTMRVSGLTVDGGRRLFERDDQLLGEVADDPAAEAAASLLVLLEERGVVVEGGSRATQFAPSDSQRVAAIRSAPLRDLLRRTVQFSDNHLADAVFRTLGAAAGDPTWQGSAAAALDALQPLGIDWSGAHFADGSGLSRDDRLSARQLALLEQQMLNSDEAALWSELLAVAGESGTLRKRYLGTVADHRLRGKTGALTDARALAGSVDGPNGERLHFAIVASDLSEAAVPVARRLQDVLVYALAEDLYGCVRVAIPQETPPPTPAPTPGYVLECAV